MPRLEMLSVGLQALSPRHTNPLALLHQVRLLARLEERQQNASATHRQGVRYHLQHAISVINPETMEPVPADGETMGEIMFRGNTKP